MFVETNIVVSKEKESIYQGVTIKEIYLLGQEIM